MNKMILGFVVMGLSTLSFAAHAEVEITGSCLEKIESAIDDTNEDDTGCVKGAYVDSVLDVRGDVYSVSYGRSVCEGYINGEADATLKDITQKTRGGKTVISECKVVNLEITDESGD